MAITGKPPHPPAPPHARCRPERPHRDGPEVLAVPSPCGDRRDRVPVMALPAQGARGWRRGSSGLWWWRFDSRRACPALPYSLAARTPARPYRRCTYEPVHAGQWEWARVPLGAGVLGSGAGGRAGRGGPGSNRRRTSGEPPLAPGRAAASRQPRPRYRQRWRTRPSARVQGIPCCRSSAWFVLNSTTSACLRPHAGVSRAAPIATSLGSTRFAVTARPRAACRGSGV